MNKIAMLGLSFSKLRQSLASWVGQLDVVIIKIKDDSANR
jgi:hypothetical protein